MAQGQGRTVLSTSKKEEKNSYGLDSKYLGMTIFNKNLFGHAYAVECPTL